MQLAASTKPADTINEAGSAIIGILKSNKLSKANKKQKISSIFKSTFSQQRMAQAALRTYYKELNPTQKKEFAALFSEFILEFYLDKMDLYNDNELLIEETILKRKGKLALVKTSITLPSGGKAAINYSLYNDPQKGWQVYDFEIEGVRMSTTYFSQLSAIYKKGKYPGLQKELRRLLALY